MHLGPTKLAHCDKEEDKLDDKVIDLSAISPVLPPPLHMLVNLAAEPAHPNVSTAIAHGFDVE